MSGMLELFVYLAFTIRPDELKDSRSSMKLSLMAHGDYSIQLHVRCHHAPQCKVLSSTVEDEKANET